MEGSGCREGRGEGKERNNVINPRRACAARVTVLGLCVCLSTFILELQATKRQVNGTLVFSATNARKIMWPILL